ncbi:MAG: zf-HC2 domain-containing protein [Chloroflexota bacterium]
MIDCREAVRRLWPYLDSSLEPRPVEELQEHLAVCQRCCGELEFSRELRGLLASSAAPPLPDQLRDRIEHLLAVGPGGGPEP